MLVVNGITKRYGDNLVLERVSFVLNRGDRLGLIGPNGCGKTTLLHIIIGAERPDSGSVALNPPDLNIGYLPQGLQTPDNTSIGDLLNPSARELAHVETELARISDQIAIAGDDAAITLAEDYDRALDRLRALSIQVSDGHMDSILASLGMADMALSTPVGELSGGQKTRLGLAKVLLSGSQLLLLDEPTNHLDIEMLEWLEGWLEGFGGGILIVSHDRVFLNRTVHRVLDLDPDTHTLCEYAGNYSAYLDQYLIERGKQMAAYRDQEYEMRRMRHDIVRAKEQARRVERGTIDSSQRRYAMKVARKARAREKKLTRYVESDERVEKPRWNWRMKLAFTEPQHLGSDVLITEDLSIGYPDCESLLRELNLHLRAGARVALTGVNGSGKTTLLRTIAGHLQPVTGSVRLGSSVRLGYMPQEQELLDIERSALETIQSVAPMGETEARNFLHFFLFGGDDPLRPARDLSFGERARLILAVLVAQGSNFLLLDEPINHLDIPSRSRFEMALAQFEGTVLAVVHDRYFIDAFAAEIWVVEGEGIKVDI